MHDPNKYLEQIASRKWLGAQNRKHPNRDIQKYFRK